MKSPLIHVQHMHVHLPAAPSLGVVDLGKINLSTAAQFANADARFELSPDGSYATDLKTGIQWAIETTDYMTYSKAEKYVAELKLGGLSGWIIGSQEQRETITDRARFNPAMPPPFKGEKWEWTSTPYLPAGNDEEGKPRALWQVDGSSGDVGDGTRDGGYGVVRPCRLVPRPGQ